MDKSCISQLSVCLYLVASGHNMRLWANVEHCCNLWIAAYQEGACFIPDWGLASLRMNLGQSTTLLLLSVVPHKISLLLYLVKLAPWILSTNSLSALLVKPNGETLKGFYVLNVFGQLLQIWVTAIDIGTGHRDPGMIIILASFTVGSQLVLSLQFF